MLLSFHMRLKCQIFHQTPPYNRYTLKSSELVKVKVSLAFTLKVHPPGTNGLSVSGDKKIMSSDRAIWSKKAVWMRKTAAEVSLPPPI